MCRSNTDQKQNSKLRNDAGQRGSAIVIALFVLALLSVFVALAMSRTAAQAASVGNETSEGKTFYAAQGSLETMTRNFNKVFEVKLNPTNTELDAVRNGAVSGLSGFSFKQELDQTSTRTNVVLSGGPFTGLYAIRDNWRLRTTAVDCPGVDLNTTPNTPCTQIQLTRNVLNNRIPIFQFGIFYDDDLELYRPPLFSFGGRVHTNNNFFISPGGAGVYFDSRVTAVGQVVTQTWRNGYTGDSGNSNTFIKNASGVYKQLLPTMGSVLNTTSGAANNIWAGTDYPPSMENTSFGSQSAIFDGNLQNEVKPLKLPVKIDSDSTDLIEMIRRGKKIADSSGGDLYTNASGTLAPVTATSADSDILKEEKYANKPGIRISLSDSKAKLPGCASGSGTAAITGACGIRLDGAKDGINPMPSPSPSPTPDRSRGYQPVGMKLTTGASTYAYVPTRINGERLYTGGSREVWIKVETVDINASTGAVVTKDITQEFLSLGVTEPAYEIKDSSNVTKFKITDSRYDNTTTNNSLIATTAQTASVGTDSRAVIKLQRFLIPGPQIPNSTTPYTSYFAVSGKGSYNVVERFSGVDATKIANGCSSGCTALDTYPDTDGDSTDDEKFGQLYLATVDGNTNRAIVPFPIQMFDSREGEYYDDSTRYTAGEVTRNGTMSMIDIDVSNLRRLLRGDFDNLFQPSTTFPSGFKSTDVPQRAGWVVYVSDRRGDADFDGEYDMEDVYGANPGNDGTLQKGEDINGNGVLDAKYISPTTNSCVGSVSTCEAPKFADTFKPDIAAVNDQKYYRRGVRLINGTTIPGIYDTATPANTRGFTFASENGVYVDGNYNATGVASIPATGNTPYSDYLPFNTSLHIPASIVGDSVTILSNSKYYASGSSLSNYDDGWNDAKSFAYPYDQGQRLATPTTIRFAMISGDTISSFDGSPSQGGISPRMNGGVHNFKRYLERWTNPSDSSFSVNLNYSGSLINLFYSHNNNGSFKCCDTVYNPPVRNWVFDSTFLDPDRLPPGTPYFQYIQTTGFQKTNN